MATGGKHALAIESGKPRALKRLMKIPRAYLIISGVGEFSTGSETA